jgi:hypothetical protein
MVGCINLLCIFACNRTFLYNEKWLKQGKGGMFCVSYSR